MKKHTGGSSRARSCAGKKVYNQDAAEDMARFVMSRDGSLMDAYRCPHGCVLADGSSGWHIGHRTVTKRTRLSRK